MTILTITANLGSQFAFQDSLGTVRDAGTYSSDTWYRSNASGEYLSIGFPSITIPSGATINSATFDVYVPISSADEPNHDLDAEDIANATLPVAGSQTFDISNRTGTTAKVNWYSANLGAAGTFTSPDISTILQELVDSYGGLSSATVLIRFNWLTGGDIGIGTPADGSSTATLTIDYTDGGSSGAVTTQDILTGTPSIGTSDIANATTTRAVFPVSIETGAPGVSPPVITNATTVRGVTLATIVTGSPILEPADISNITTTRDVSLASLLTGAPILGTSDIANAGTTRAVIPADITTGTPSISSPAVSRVPSIRAIALGGITTGAPVISQTTVTNAVSVKTLVTLPIVTGAPQIEAPVLIRSPTSRDVISDSILTGAPVIGATTITKFASQPPRAFTGRISVQPSQSSLTNTRISVTVQPLTIQVTKE